MILRPKLPIPVRLLVLALALGCVVVAEVPADTAKGTWPPPRCETTYPGYWDTTYWKVRKVVTLLLHCDSSGTVTRGELFGDRSGGADIDSLMALVRHWRFPPKASPSQKGKPFTEVAHFVFDHSASSVPDRAARGLPDFAETALQEPPFKRWVQAWADHSPSFEFSDFVTCGCADMVRAPWKRVLDDPHMVRKRAFGLLLDSPDGRYVLDPFAGFEVETNGEVGGDIDTGYATFDGETGDRLHYWVTTNNGIYLANWVNATTFVMLGTKRLDHPGSDSEHFVCAWVPAVWIGDMSTEEIAYYLGLPVSPTEWPGLRRQLAGAMASAYPRVTW